MLKSLPSACTQAHRWFLKFTIDLWTVSYGKSFQIFISSPLVVDSGDINRTHLFTK